MPDLVQEIPPHEQPIALVIKVKDPGNAVSGVSEKCEHDHGNGDYTCSPSDLPQMQKLFCKVHRHGFYGHCETHLLDQIQGLLAELVALVTPPPPPPVAPEPVPVDVATLLAEPSL